MAVSQLLCVFSAGQTNSLWKKSTEFRSPPSGPLSARSLGSNPQEPHSRYLNFLGASTSSKS